jgi:hypothetical protein
MSWLTVEHYYRLVDHVLLEVALPEEKANGKYPMVAADVLSADNGAISGVFFPAVPHTEEYEVDKVIVVKYDKPEDEDRGQAEDEETTEEPEKKTCIIKSTNVKERLDLKLKLVAGLTSPKANETMVGYICKILNNLLNKNFQAMVVFFYEHSLFDKFRPWLLSRSVADLMIRFISLDGKEVPDAEVPISSRIALIQKLLGVLQEPGEAAAHASCILLDVFSKFVASTTSQEAISLTAFTVEKALPFLIDLVLRNINLRHVLPILIAAQESPEIKLTEEQLGSILRHSATLLFQKRERLGMEAFRLLQLVVAALKEQPQLELAWVLASGYNASILELTLRYEFNDMMHYQLSQLITNFQAKNEMTWFTHNDTLANFLATVPCSPLVIRGATFTRGYTSVVTRLLGLLPAQSAEGDDLAKVRQVYLERYQGRTRTNLGGLSFSAKKDENASVIFLSKNEAFEEFRAFLTMPFRIIDEAESAKVFVQEDLEEDTYSSHQYWKLDYQHDLN